MSAPRLNPAHVQEVRNAAATLASHVCTLGWARMRYGVRSGEAADQQLVVKACEEKLDRLLVFARAEGEEHGRNEIAGPGGDTELVSLLRDLEEWFDEDGAHSLELEMLGRVRGQLALLHKPGSAGGSDGK